METRLIIVGGFLGAGKTTLLYESAKHFMESGYKVGLITNDQADGLVDTVFLEQTKGIVSEVSGSCFCCNYNGFKNVLLEMTEGMKADIILAEPVGSCTDLSATILQPLKEQMGNRMRISPLSVLVDAIRLKDILDGGRSGLHRSAVYILKKQLEEADIVVINKTDLIPTEQVSDLVKRAEELYPLAKVYPVSVKDGEGLEHWIEAATRVTEAGTHLLDIDYDIYAEGEAVLGWLNTSIELKGDNIDWNVFAKELLHILNEKFINLDAPIGHLKLIIQSDNQNLIGNVTGQNYQMDFRGNAGNGKEAVLTLNARVQMSPEELNEIIQKEISLLCKDAVVSNFKTLHYLSPERPNPTYRYEHVV